MWETSSQGIRRLVCLRLGTYQAGKIPFCLETLWLNLLFWVLWVIIKTHLPYREPSRPKSSYPELLRASWMSSLGQYCRPRWGWNSPHSMNMVVFYLWAFLKGHQLFMPISFFWPLLATASLEDSLQCKQAAYYDNSSSSKQHINMA